LVIGVKWDFDMGWVTFRRVGCGCPRQSGRYAMS
jgi:hypothetical protein